MAFTFGRMVKVLYAVDPIVYQDPITLCNITNIIHGNALLRSPFKRELAVQL